MKLFMFHMAVVIFHIEGNIDFYRLSFPIFRGVKPLGDNVWIFLPSLVTFWNMALQQIYFIVSLIEDVSRLRSDSKVVAGSTAKQQRSSLLFTHFVFPFTVVVSANFWVLYTVDSRLVDEFDVLTTYVTTWDNHRMHTVTVVLALVEMFIRQIPYPKDILSEIKAPIGLLLLYVFYIAVVQSQATIWIYNILGTMQWYEYILCSLMNILLIAAAYVIGKVISETLWEKQSLRQKISFLNLTKPKKV